MAAGYVDDHKLILYRDGAQPRDITAFASDMTLTDDLDTLAAELTFKTFISPWDKYTPKLALAPGDKVRVTNQGKTVFSGVIITVTLDGGVTAYDRGWYLNKSEIVLQVNNLAADQVIRKACAKAGMTVGKVCSLPTKITQLWTGLYAVRHYQRCAEHLHVCDRQAVPPPRGRQRPAGRGTADRTHQGISQAGEKYRRI